jgi:hypothetical protein
MGKGMDMGMGGICTESRFRIDVTAEDELRCRLRVLQHAIRNGLLASLLVLGVAELRCLDCVYSPAHFLAVPLLASGDSGPGQLGLVARRVAGCLCAAARCSAVINESCCGCWG